MGFNSGFKGLTTRDTWAIHMRCETSLECAASYSGQLKPIWKWRYALHAYVT